MFGSDVAARAGAVFHHKGTAQRLCVFRRQHAGHDVRGAARLVADDNLPLRILGQRQRCTCSQHAGPNHP
ncbi:hypothetical protein SDC9_99563 [bioreactor metagenome]|uniref:Uncharacterized protein n=1 Tax=bioreactor metagenome TaxID=1076179 RepID=A0A645AHZ2_9ZZZZ